MILLVETLIDEVEEVAQVALIAELQVAEDDEVEEIVGKRGC
jgi:hypothetical protein